MGEIEAYLSELDARVFAAAIAATGVIVSAIVSSLVSYLVSAGQTKQNARLERTQKELSLLLESLKELRAAMREFQEVDTDDSRDEEAAQLCMDGKIHAVLKKREYLFSPKEFERLSNFYNANASPHKALNYPNGIQNEFLRLARSMRNDLGLKDWSGKKWYHFT